MPSHWSPEYSRHSRRALRQIEEEKNRFIFLILVVGRSMQALNCRMFKLEQQQVIKVMGAMQFTLETKG